MNISVKFDDLPAEVKLYVFSFFNAKELNQKVAKVSTKWRRLCTDVFLWKELNLDAGTKTKEQIFKALNRNQCVRCVNFFSINDFEWFTRITKHTSVRCVQFLGCNCSEQDVMQFVKTFPYVDEIAVNGCDRIGGDIVLQMAGEWNLLKSVYLSCMSEENVAKYVPLIATKVKVLEKIDIPRISNETFQYLVDVQGANLKSLSANAWKINTKSYVRLIRNCVNLTHISLRAALIMSDVDLSLLQNLRSLRSLKINSAVRLFSDNFPRRFKNVKFVSLTNLTIEWCGNIDDNALKTFLECCPILKKLNINGAPKITDEGLRIIPRSCRNLENLSVARVDLITKNCVEEIVHEMPRLIYFIVIECIPICDHVSYVVIDKRM